MTILQFINESPVFSFLTILVIAAVIINMTDQVIRVFTSRKK